MRVNYGIGQLSASEKSDILDQHKSLYNGYRTMQPEVSNTQPLYVYDAAGDKDGLVVNNKGEVKKYTNFGINEQVSKKPMCECGGEMYEGECMECGNMMGEGTGHLDDIYNQKDLNLKHGDFDYVEGGGNDYGTFEGKHKKEYKEDATDDKPYEKGERGMKSSRARASFVPTPKENEIISKLFGQYGNDIPPIVIRYLRKLPRKVFTKRLLDLGLLDVDTLKTLDEQVGNNYDSFERTNKKEYKEDDNDKYVNYDDNFEDTDNEDDGFEDMELGNEIEEQGGNAPDMNTDFVEPAYDFDSNGPDSVYPVNEFDDEEYEYEPMKSAWDDDDEDVSEQDVSGTQGIYGDMDKAYDFDSDGPGKGGPYQESSYESVVDEEDEWEEIDTDLQEEFKTQKNKITEMFNRMNKYN